MVTLEPPRNMDVASAEDWREWELSRVGLNRFLGTASNAVGLRGEVEVLLAGDATLKRLNRQYRGKNKATDVLSFPAMPEMAEVFAGDLAISLETAARQAEEHGHALKVEVRVLLLHGLLHLAGMDHEVDGGEMAVREAELRGKLRLPSGLIARVEQKDNAKKEKSAERRAGLNAGAKERRSSSRMTTKKTTAKAERGFPSGMTSKKVKKVLA